MFLVVVQEETVLDIFFDILAVSLSLRAFFHIDLLSSRFSDPADIERTFIATLFFLAGICREH